MYILGIETSCDETSLALLRAEKSSSHTAQKIIVLDELIHSQADLHNLYGGVVPELAAREHLSNLPLLYHQLLQNVSKKDAAFSPSAISLIGVTTGPGLKGSLLTGMMFASGLSSALGVPLLPVNHIEGHVLSVLLDQPNIPFPFLSLVVSGGHTELHLVEGIGRYTLLARTVDDAAGEAFDKSAKLLGLDYPGGPRLAAAADKHSSTPNFSSTTTFTLPKVMLNNPGFSFSGLKTAISQLIKAQQEVISEEAKRNEIAWCIQEAIVDALIRKVERAVEITHAKHIAVCGGVSANERLREKLALKRDITVYFPKLFHCMDNATMIALTAYYRKIHNLPSPSFEARARWPIETSSQEGTV